MAESLGHWKNWSICPQSPQNNSIKATGIHPVPILTPEEILIVTGRGPLPSLHHRFQLSDRSLRLRRRRRLHPLFNILPINSLSWHIRKLLTSLGSLSYQGVLNNPTSRKNIKNMIKFIIDSEVIQTRIIIQLPLSN
ncbi:hypothetical protein AVEN_26218-1 [Araneus ventricosus]|uniref:Uncharacterized protein n=1 Tax=Araneus ventricosus TaxID=182803 RepID=A0A4Y2AMN9_ARAVE|nr:hypothetical protein AVEN_26218-1 [Araneus ventricosus]